MDKKSILKFSTVSLVCAMMSASAVAAPNHVINISGATLFEPFFLAPASTSDFIDADNNGVVTDFSQFQFEQLAGANPNSSFWAVQYRAVGSGNGLADLVTYGQTPATVAGNGDLKFPDPGLVNRAEFYNQGTIGLGNAANPGSSPFLSSGGGVRIDIGVTDVPTTWFVTQGTEAQAKWNKAPTELGYGMNARLSNATGDGQANQAGGQGNKLKSLGGLNTNTSNPDANTVFDNEIAWVPIAYIANHGTGIDADFDGTVDGNIKKTQLQHLYVTGRLENGENLVAVTRDSGSGTRNGAMNSIGVDPSWGVGENVGKKNKLKENDKLGGEFVATNKNSSSRMEQTVRNHRLAVGYTGLAGESKAARESADNQYEIMNVMNDTDGGTVYVRPVMGNGGQGSAHNNIIWNGDANTGWQIGGSETFATIGNPFATAINTEYGATSTDPAMANAAAAAYLRNILESIAAFEGAPSDPANEGTPGQFLATQFALISAVEALPTLLDPANFANQDPGDVNLDLRQTQFLPTESTLPSSYGAVGFGWVSERLTGAVYSDGVANGANYITNGGTAVNYNTKMFTGNVIHERNAVAGDFDNNGLRTKDDIAAMVNAFQNANNRAALAATDANAVLELLGDFNGDGNFDQDDVRYGLDGLFVAGRAGNKLDRKQNFIDGDIAAGGNLFGYAAHSTGSAYAAGDARADIAGNTITAGAAPSGADGVIDQKDIDAVFAAFVGKDQDSTNGVEWANLDEAVFSDLSADMTGDLIINKADADELVHGILGTEYGDANLDGVIDLLDFDKLSAAFNTDSGWEDGDFNGDGTVDLLDFDVLSSNFGFGSGGATVEEIALLEAFAATVPEPASLMLLALGGLLVAGRKRN
ncbi:PEP-CTERM sorting domain-containing protein [Poriferisphaera sp. WC338]|uniref:PEP-CTERM sorting domain-containing protein n=1 Tax=Poriferisphaera sp. WC338 TaxID=3425129 RepID=UPI003D8170CE